MGLSGKQTGQLLELLTESRPPDPRGRGLNLDLFVKLSEIPGEKYVAILGDEDWLEFKTELDLLKQQLELMRNRRAQPEESSPPKRWRECQDGSGDRILARK